MSTHPVAEAEGPRWLYLHGFASGPESSKGRAFASHFGERGVRVARLNLRVPSFEHLRLSAMMTTVRTQIGGEHDRAIVVGSSLGGLCAARVAEQDARVCALVLMAPAFCMAERWRARLGEAEYALWQSRGYLEVDDYAEGGKKRVDFGFIREASEMEETLGGWPDVRVPTLIVHGQRDDVVDIDLSRTWARGKKHVRLVEVDDAHDLPQSIPLILSESEQFLKNFLG